MEEPIHRSPDDECHGDADGEGGDADWPDALFVSCMNYDAITVAENLEQIIRKPVVTSHTATLWRALALASIHDPIAGAGALLADTR